MEDYQAYRLRRNRLQLALFNLIMWNQCKGLTVPYIDAHHIDWDKLESKILSLKYPSGVLMSDCPPLFAKSKRKWLTKKEKTNAFGFCVGKFGQGLYFTAD